MSKKLSRNQEKNFEKYLFPQVNFIGNKRKLSKVISDSLPINQGVIMDLFSGGTSVSYEFKKKGFQVISNDSMYSSYVLNKALIENSHVTLPFYKVNSSLKYELDNSQRNELSWLENTLFYADEVDELAKLVFFSLELEHYEKYLFQSLIRRAMIRKLPYSRMNLNWENIKKLRNEEYSYKKYGRRRAYHNQSFITHIHKDLVNYNNAVFDNKKNNIAIQMDAIQAVQEFKNVDILYLDPPYPGTMNNYSGFYGDFDEIFKHKIDYTDWTHGNSFLYNLQCILDEAAKNNIKYLLLSINSQSKPSYKEIIEMFNFYGTVNIKHHKHNYQVSGRENKNKNQELVITLKFFR